MDQNKLYSFLRRKAHLSGNDRRSNSTPTLSFLSDNNSAVSSVLLSMCPLSKNSNICSLNDDNVQSIAKTSENNHESIDTFLCRTCHKSNASNQLDVCLQCHQNQLKTNSNSLQLVPFKGNFNSQTSRSQSLDIEEKVKKDKKRPSENKAIELFVHAQNKCKKKLNYQLVIRLLNLSRERQSSVDLSCIYQILLQPKLAIETTLTNAITCPPTISRAQAILLPRSLCLSKERINHFKQRQSELDRSVQKLIESLKIKTNENINLISKYWSCLKQSSLDQLHPKTNRYQIFDYLSKSSSSNKQFQCYLEENDEIKAVLQVLSTTLTIVRDKYSTSTLNQLFDHEEKTMTEKLRYQLEVLLSSYADELLFMTERIHFYEFRFGKGENLDPNNGYDWMQIIQHDYPSLIEKISNDFVIKTPQIEQILIQMLRNMKKRLLSTEIIK